METNIPQWILPVIRKIQTEYEKLGKANHIPANPKYDFRQSLNQFFTNGN